MNMFLLICLIITALVFWPLTIRVAVLVTVGYALFWVYVLITTFAPIHVEDWAPKNTQQRWELAHPDQVASAPTPNAYEYVNAPGEEPRTAFDPAPGTPAKKTMDNIDRFLGIKKSTQVSGQWPTD